MKSARILVAVSAFAVGGLFCGVAVAGWGDLKMTFKLDGKAPAAKSINVNKDVEVCGKHKLVDEQLVVNSANSGIANVIVWLAPDKGAKVDTHADYKKDEKKELAFDNLNCRFEPHVLGVWKSNTVIAGNKDPVGHNINVPYLGNSPINVLIPSNGSVKLNHKIEERLPVKVTCNIHPWMNAYMVVKDTPYIGVSNENGELTIKNLPSGTWAFTVWHEASGYVSEVSRAGKTESWKKGKLDKVVIKDGANDLGEVKIQLKAFKLQ